MTESDERDVFDLADVLSARPELAERLVVTQMGGALNRRDPERADHNFRVDPASAAVVLANTNRPKFALSETTYVPELEIRKDSVLYQRFSDNSAPRWARLVAAHLDQWFARFHPGTYQHDAFALGAALQVPFVGLYGERVSVDSIGRMSLDPDGARVWLSRWADHALFMRWLSERLDEAMAANR